MRSIPPQPRRSGKKVKRWWESPSNGKGEIRKVIAPRLLTEGFPINYLILEALKRYHFF